jgi:cytosine/adenosine deaminase-related metal-dependent hydrolase
VDAFEARYSEPLRPEAALSLAALRQTRGQAGALPGQAWALGGAVILADSTLDHGWVTIEGTTIASVSETKPTSALTLETGGVIMPGLIDLHGHPEWNVFPAWEPPHLYADRYKWQQSPEYLDVIKNPMNALSNNFSDQSFLMLAARYAEVRALIGGTTAIQGASSSYPTANQALVRHVDLAPFGTANAYSLVAPLNPQYSQECAKVLGSITSGLTKAFYVHIAEGIDPASAKELDTLDQMKLLTAATVIIHGTGLTHDQLQKVRDVGAKLVWSPQSELRLYGQTGQVAAARSLGIPLTIGADWIPSGSLSLLAEIQVARRLLAEQGAIVAASELVAMVTITAATIADLDSHIGTLATGRPADILVLERRNDDPYETVCQARRSSVELVCIDGHLLYGRDDWFDTLAPKAAVHDRRHPNATGERIRAWGKKMRLDIAAPADPSSNEPALPGLAVIRAQLISRYDKLGPIFA